MKKRACYLKKYSLCRHDYCKARNKPMRTVESLINELCKILIAREDEELIENLPSLLKISRLISGKKKSKKLGNKIVFLRYGK